MSMRCCWAGPASAGKLAAGRLWTAQQVLPRFNRGWVASRHNGWLCCRQEQARRLSSSLSGPAPFDTHTLVCRLEEQQFTRGQAETISRALQEVLVGTVKVERREFVSRVELDKTVLRMETQLKMHIGARKHDLESAVTRLREEIEKQGSNQRLDMNLERARSKEELRAVEDRLRVEAKRLEDMLIAQQQALLNVKNDLLKTLVAMLMSAAGVAIGVLRLVGNGVGSGSNKGGTSTDNPTLGEGIAS